MFWLVVVGWDSQRFCFHVILQNKRHVNRNVLLGWFRLNRCSKSPQEHNLVELPSRVFEPSLTYSVVCHTEVIIVFRPFNCNHTNALNEDTHAGTYTLTSLQKYQHTRSNASCCDKVVLNTHTKTYCINLLMNQSLQEDIASILDIAAINKV